MQIEFINITTYAGISSEAEHYYAKIGYNNMHQEMLLTDSHCKPDSGIFYINGKSLIYFPTRKEAEQMWEKDHRWEKDKLEIARHKEGEILDFMEDGTQRFPSILEIIRAARKKFPKTMLCFSFQGSVSEFTKRIKKLCQNDKEYETEIENLINENDERH